MMGSLARKHESAPEPKPIETGLGVLERIQGIEHVKTFLRKELRDKEKTEKETEVSLQQFCDENVCHLWRVEPHLMTELIKEKNETARDRLRKFIYAVSWRSHKRPELSALKKQEASLQDFLERSVLQATKLVGRVDKDEDLEQAEAIKEAVEDRSKNGKDLTSEVGAIEDFVGRAYEKLGVDLRHHGLNWSLLSLALPQGQDLEQMSEEELKDAISHKLYLPEKTKPEERVKNQITQDLLDIQRLRGLRDYLYFKYLYPNWLKAQR